MCTQSNVCGTTAISSSIIAEPIPVHVAHSRFSEAKSIFARLQLFALGINPYSIASTLLPEHLGGRTRTCLPSPAASTTTLSPNRFRSYPLISIFLTCQAEPGRERVFFAGEHTCRNYPGWWCWALLRGLCHLLLLIV